VAVSGCPVYVSAEGWTTYRGRVWNAHSGRGVKLGVQVTVDSYLH